MFLDYWKLREQPFGVTSDPRYLYFSSSHREALASLFYGIETGRGFLSLIAQPGMGKTTLLLQLLQRWRGHVHSAFLFQTQCNSRELLRYLLGDLGLKNDGEDVVRMHSELDDFLLRETKAGKRVVVFIDEAQNLSDTVLETVRLLSNFEAPDKKLLQIVLTGQLELEERLSSPSLAQLRQRIAVRARLDPLPPPEVICYINRRLQVAGYAGPGLFTPGALNVIAELSRGVPRLINVLCFNAMSLGLAMRRQQINSEIVREAAEGLPLELPVAIPKVQQMPAVPTARPVAPPAPSVWKSVCSWMKGSIGTRRVVRASALSFLLAGVAVYVGAHGGASVRHPAISNASSASASPSTVAESPTSPPMENSSSQPQPQAATLVDSGAGSSDSFTYVVQLHDTIMELCRSAFGYCDASTLEEIRRLNPGLKNPNRLEVGQEVRLPLNPKKQGSADLPGSDPGKLKSE
jgi:general secretion pathway protein A